MKLVPRWPTHQTIVTAGNRLLGHAFRSRPGSGRHRPRWRECASLSVPPCFNWAG